MKKIKEDRDHKVQVEAVATHLSGGPGSNSARPAGPAQKRLPAS